MAVSCAASVITTLLNPSPVINPLILYPNSDITINPARTYIAIFVILNIAFIVDLSISLLLLSLIFTNTLFFSSNPSPKAFATKIINNIFIPLSNIDCISGLIDVAFFIIFNAIYIPTNVKIVLNGK